MFYFDVFFVFYSGESPMHFQHNHEIKGSSLFIENKLILSENNIFRTFYD